MHNWSDEKCVTILKNCRKAIPERSGKIIIVDGVLQPADGDRVLDTFVARYRFNDDGTKFKWRGKD